MVNTGEIISYNSQIWLSQEYVLQHAGVTYPYLRVAKTRAKTDASKAWQHAVLLNRCYFSYTALPVHCANRLVPIAQLAQLATELHNDVTTIVQTAASNRYRQFRNGFADNDDLARAAAIIHEAGNYCRANGVSFNKSPFFERLGNEVHLQGIKYLPRNWRNLRNKVQAYTQGQPVTKIVAAKNTGNKNRAVYAGNHLVMGWIEEMADSQKNYSYAFIWRKLVTICAQHAIGAAPSQRWVASYLMLPATQFRVQERFGANSRFNHKYRAYTPTQSALFAGDCWDIDGTRVNLISHHAGYTIDKNGKRTPKQKFLYIIAVRDVMSGDVLAREYCYQENAQAVINALAQAVKTTGYLPYELRYDRFPGHNTPVWQWVENGMQAAGVIMSQTHKAEGKARIERWWGTLQNVFMAESNLYYGEGVRSTRRYAHRATEYVQAMVQQAKTEGFNFNDATAETDRILENYTSTPYSAWSAKYKTITQSPAQLHTACTKPNTTTIEHAHYCYLFGLHKKVSIRNNMVLTQIANATYYYAITDVTIIEKYTGVKLLNCFDIEDLNQVHLFDGANYIGSFNQLTPAQQYGPKKDMRAVGKIKAIAEKTKAHRLAKSIEIENAKETALQNLEAEEAEAASGTFEIGIRLPKHQAEAAETAFLQEQWADDDDEQELKINIWDSNL